MSLQMFSAPQTRFLVADSVVYKILIRGGRTFSEAPVEDWVDLQQELEDIVRTVLGNTECLQPFTSINFLVHPYKRLWESASLVVCKHHEELKAYPFTLILVLEKKDQEGTVSEETESNDEGRCLCPRPFKRPRTDSPLEGAILNRLVKEMEADCPVAVVKSGTELVVLQDAAEKLLADNKTRVDAEKERKENEENESKGPPVEPWILLKLAKSLFPFSRFFRKK